MAEDAQRWRRPRGVPPLTAKRDHYLRLMKQGMSNSEACRRAGINRRTGTRWRFGRTVALEDGRQLYYAPIATPRVASRRFLSEDERITIADGLRSGRSRRSIATELGRSPSTISREVARNCDPNTGEYRPWAAQQQTVARRCRPKPRKLVAYEQLRLVVQHHLDRRWSPEQIANTLREDFPGRPDMQITAESIYQEIYAPDSMLRRERPVLRTRRLHRRRRSRGHRQDRFVVPMVMIRERPAEVADRTVAGHWEGDLLVGAHNRSAIATLVERSTRFTILLQLGRQRSAERLRDEMIETFNGLPIGLRRSLTWDQGIEMARHHEFAAATGMAVYFCDPASPWQRPTNENTNGLLRQYFPKGTDLSTHSLDDIRAVANELNRRPRKTLRWRSPAAQLSTLLNHGALP
jgi:transposase, IS30 family